MDRRAFERVVEEALRSLPREIRKRIDNVEVFVEDEPTEDDPGDRRTTDLFGVYEGVPLLARSGGYSGVNPDRIVIFRKPIMRHFSTRSSIIRQIQLTVLHELGHHLGFNEEEIRRVIPENDD